MPHTTTDRDREAAEADVDDYVFAGEQPFDATLPVVRQGVQELLQMLDTLTHDALMTMSQARVKEIRAQITALQEDLGHLGTRVYVAATLGRQAARSLPLVSGEVHSAFMSRP